MEGRYPVELNPNHKVTASVHDEWHKFAAILMSKFGQDEVEITIEDVEKIRDGERCIVMDNRGDKCVLRLMSMDEGERLARQEGGLPV